MVISQFSQPKWGERYKSSVCYPTRQLGYRFKCKKQTNMALGIRQNTQNAIADPSLTIGYQWRNDMFVRLFSGGNFKLKLASLDTLEEANQGKEDFLSWKYFGTRNGWFVLTPRKLTWLAKRSTIWRCISYWKWGCSNVMLVFRGVHPLTPRLLEVSVHLSFEFGSLNTSSSQHRAPARSIARQVIIDLILSWYFLCSLSKKMRKDAHSLTYEFFFGVETTN